MLMKGTANEGTERKKLKLVFQEKFKETHTEEEEEELCMN